MFNDDQCNCFHQRPSSSGDVVNVDRLESPPGAWLCSVLDGTNKGSVSDIRHPPPAPGDQAAVRNLSAHSSCGHLTRHSNLQSLYKCSNLVGGGGEQFSEEMAKCNNQRACSCSEMSLRLVKTLHLNKSNAPGSHQLDLSSGPVSAQSRAGPRYGHNSSLITSYARKHGKFKTSTHHIIH